MPFSDELRERSKKTWEEGYNHPFVQELGEGTLAPEKFKFYLLQDYLYLWTYAKVFALGAVKADTEGMTARFSASQNAILNGEMNLHRNYMRTYGITQREMDAVKPSLFNRAYTSYMLAAGQAGGTAEILAAIFPCAWTYYDYAKRLSLDYRDEKSENFFKSWIDGYASDEFYESFSWIFGALDSLCEHKSKSERERIGEIFEDCVKFEYMFWDMSYKRQMSHSE